MPFIIMIAVFVLVSILSSAAKNAAKDAERQKQTQSRQGPTGQRPAMQQSRPYPGKPDVFNVPEPKAEAPVFDNKTVITKPVKPAVSVQQSREQLERDVKELIEAVTGRKAAAGTPSQKQADKDRKERELRQIRAEREKPLAAQADDCGGGSIHDGYHEGVSGDPFGEKKPRPAVAGNLGKKLAAEDDRQEAEHIAAENARRALARISKLPPIAQGMVYSEILGKPRSEAY